MEQNVKYYKTLMTCSDLPFPSSVKVNKAHSYSVYCTVCVWHGA